MTLPCSVVHKRDTQWRISTIAFQKFSAKLEKPDSKHLHHARELSSVSLDTVQPISRLALSVRDRDNANMVRLNGVNDPIWELQQMASSERLVEHTVLERYWNGTHFRSILSASANTFLAATSCRLPSLYS